jgi:integrase/recombinase XerD
MMSGARNAGSSSMAGTRANSSGSRHSCSGWTELDDIGWHHGEIIVRGKGRRDERMPLPAEVGQALVEYLMASRPIDAPELRTVFLAARAPRRPMDRGTVSSLIARACQRAGIEPVGAHLLRHSLGEELIRADVPLAAIGQVLRHHDPLTTANYARVDVERLRSLALPWPTSTPYDAAPASDRSVTP